MMPPAKQWTILAIDDEEDVREVIRLTLEDAGYNVFTAPEGNTGLKLCDEVMPQVVITDIRMPGLDGLKVLEAVKKRHPEMEVIVATAFGEMDLAIRALQLDASDFINKPIHVMALQMALDRAKHRYTTRKKLADYTELLERENIHQAQILHQDKMMSLGRLAASLVHEINNPLSGILNYLRLMHRMMDRSEFTPSMADKFKGYLEIVEKETGRCAQIISGLLSFSRKSSPVFEPIHMAELVDRCILLSRHKLELANISLICNVPQNMQPVMGDFNLLQQCIINLIFNAADAMTGGGNLTLKADYDKAAHQVTFLVKDTGPGISSQELPHIFEPFYTTKTEGHGVGLGLSTVFGIMEQHGGSVRAESRPGEGAEFFLTLPCAESSPVGKKAD
jgi:signal transduction histidine kinase